MKRTAALLLALAASDPGRAATAYVTDELVLGVYAQPATQGPRLATLHSGATVDTLAVSGDATQVRLADGVTGWVKSAYLTTGEPASVRLKQLEDELERSKATPRRAEGAERDAVARLSQELAKRAGAGGSVAGPAGDPQAPPAGRGWTWGLVILLALSCGYGLGYAALARRIRTKFGGIKVY